MFYIAFSYPNMYSVKVKMNGASCYVDNPLPAFVGWQHKF